METIITRDTDILREYLAALDARERGLSPFAKLAATVKLAALRRELNSAQLEATDEDAAALRREIAERLSRTMSRRFESRRWGARTSIFLMLVLGQQLALAIIWLVTKLFVGFAPVPARWNPVLPHEQPAFLFVFIFFFFFTTPMLAVLVFFGGRYFRSWRRTVPATLVILAIALLATYFVVRNNERSNPVRHRTSLEEIANGKNVNVLNYRQWVDQNWLLKDPKFQRDYEEYLRKGPGRWITSRFDANTDAAWRGSIAVMGDYIETGQDPNGFREWLSYYLDRNRIYSESRINEEVEKIASASQRFLGLWQVEPYLKERDQRLYRAYLGSINTAMKVWGIILLAVFALVFLIIYLTGPMLSFWERTVGGSGARRRSQAQFAQDASPPAPSRVSQWREQYYSFPERSEISTPSFFDAPLRLLARAHRSFVRLAVFTIIFVFGFWMLIYALDLAAGHENAPTQVALMRSQLLFGGPADRRENNGDEMLQTTAGAQASSTYTTTINPMMAGSATGEGAASTGERREDLLANRMLGLGDQVDENDYQTGKKFEQQYEALNAHRSAIELLRGQTSQLEQTTTTTLPDQITQVGSRADERAGAAIGEANAAKTKADNIERQLSTKIKDVESSAASARAQAGKAEEQAKDAQTETREAKDAIYTDINELKARTSKLGERMTTVEDRQEQVNRVERLQRIAFAAILSDLKNDVEDLDRRLNSSFYRLFNKGEAQRDADALRQRITNLTNELRELNTEQAKQTLEQVEELSKRLEQIAARIK